MSTVIAEVTRGELVESQHHGIVVVANCAGQVIASAGDPESMTFFRSSAKPFQAVPLVESGAVDRFGFSPAELALCCSSHDAAPWQQQAVEAMLGRIGLGTGALRCGSAPPYDEEEAARVLLRLVPTTPLQSDCSGKHTGMLATCLHLGYPIESYLDIDHPLQQSILAVMASVLRMDPDAIAVAADGCSVPTFGAPVRNFATAYATLARPESAPPEGGQQFGPALDRIRTAMASHPQHIGGPKNLDTNLMDVTHGRIVAKLGAEGLICLAVPEEGLGIAVSVLDGSPRARATVVLATLEQLDLLRSQEIDDLRRHQSDALALTNFNGWHVGDIRAAFTLASPSSAPA